MKVTVRNPGTINQAEFDLKPLTIFIGPNNSMKTWLAYTLAGVLGRYGWVRYLIAYVHNEVTAQYQNILDNLLSEEKFDSSQPSSVVQSACICMHGRAPSPRSEKQGIDRLIKKRYLSKTIFTSSMALNSLLNWANSCVSLGSEWHR